jgi:glycosyltransferase involved in cell wall biosynthesis
MHRASGWSGEVRKIALVGNHLPRRCGIATFTTDLADAIASERSGAECVVLAMNEPGRSYDYPPRVAFELGEGDIASYRRAADFLDVSDVDVVSLQHEYGIFGGNAGAFLLDLVRELRMPLVTTLHTVLSEPNPMQRAVMNELTATSERLVVMSASGAALLQEVHGVDPQKIDLIPHGIPALPQAVDAKASLGLADHDVILTFGLLSPDKGIEYVIDALPSIVAKRPSALYVVVGVTHPHVKDSDGESYRFMLEARAKRLGVDSHVVFHDRFVSQEELMTFLSASDVYVTPYLQTEQITSGTLAYAVGSGKAVISTPYRYACELLDGGCGALVPPRDASAIARQVVDLLSNETRRHSLEQRAAARGRGMSWPMVARGYLASFAKATQSRGGQRRATFKARTLAKRPVDLPEVDLSHLRVLTDDTGILQHALHTVPRYEDGYCVDDNARALLVTTLLEESAVEPARSVRALAARYLAFVSYAFDTGTGRFRNFMSFERTWSTARASDDCHGRALWALGAVVGRSRARGTSALARSLFDAALPAADGLTSPRAWAYTMIGIDEYLRARPGEPALLATMTRLRGRLLERLAVTKTPEWPWFEDRLTYCNARLPQALLAAGARLDDERTTRDGLATLEWLCEAQTVGGLFAPIGSDGFWVRGGERAMYDQQPVEAAATLSACLDAHRATGDAAWLGRARAAFNWFLGQNSGGTPLYDPVTGGCRDGLHADRPNENQGAESTVSFLLALLELRSAERVAGPTLRAARALTPPRAGERVVS